MINSTFPADKVPNHSGRQADRQTDRETPSLSQLNVNRPEDSGHLRARTRPSLPTVNENRLLRVFYPILDQCSTHGLRRHRPDERQLLGDVFPLARAVLRDVIPDLFVLSIRVRYARPRQVFCAKYTADAGWRGIRSNRLPEASAPVAKPIRGQHAVGGGGRGAIVWTDMCTSETAW